LSNISRVPMPSELSAEEIIENSEIPPDILKMVGYDVPDTNNLNKRPKEAQNERTHTSKG